MALGLPTYTPNNKEITKLFFNKLEENYDGTEQPLLQTLIINRQLKIKFKVQ